MRQSQSGITATHPAISEWIMPENKNELTNCACNSDGECVHDQCPQIRDNEPHTTGRSCPLYDWSHEDDF